MTGRWPRRALQVGTLAVFAVLGVALVDYELTSARLPDLPPDFMASSPERIERGKLQDGYVDRTWVYALLVSVVIGAFLYTALRSAPRDQRRAVFTDLGVAGVCSGFVAAAITLEGPYLLDPSSKVMIWLPTLLMLVSAGIGSAVSHKLPAGEGTTCADRLPSQAGRPIPPLTRIGQVALGLSVVAVILLVIGSGGVKCGDQSSGSSDITLLLGALSAIVGLIGIAALLIRRWVLALLCILFPGLTLFGVASAIAPCLS